MKYHKRRTFRNRKSRRATRRRRSIRKQRGGAYVLEDLVQMISAAPNYGESKNMFEAMGSACIHVDYPRYRETVRIGQNGEELPVKNFMVLISQTQGSYVDLHHKRRDLLFINIEAQDDSFTKANIILIPRVVEAATQNTPEVEDPYSEPSRLLDLIEGREGDGPETPTQSLTVMAVEAATSAICLPIYNIILEALAQLYKMPNAEEGVSEC